MKPLFYTKTLIALAVAVAAAAAAVSQAQEQPIPPPSAEAALPPNIVPGSPLADVVKMVQAGVDAGTIQSYILNSQSPFNLDADKIIYLKDMGVPSDLVNAMMDRDKVLYASTVTPQPAPAPVTTVATSVPDTAPPPAEVTVNYFYDTLSPYGSWVDVDGYGRCWRPTVVNYDSSWRPYCDRGHWVYTDCGWYWDSDYAWGVAFHYGRWFRNPSFGWCWYPDTVWAPSWVAWRSGGDYCGWAPLPPYAEFRPGFGFYYHGASVAVNFDFGLGADSFMFVGADHFCDRHPRSFCLERDRGERVFRQTTVINNYVVNNRTIVNRGIAVDHIREVTHRNIEPIHVSSLPNAGRQGWRGEGFNRSTQHISADNHPQGFNPSANNQFRRGTEARTDANNRGGFHANTGQSSSDLKVSRGDATQGTKFGGKQFESTPTASPQSTKGFGNNNQTGFSQPRQIGNVTTGNSHVQPFQPAPVTSGGAVTERRLNNIQIGGNGGQSPAISHEQPSFQSRQPRTFGGAIPDAYQAHGAAQLQPRQFVQPDQPRVEVRPNFAESAPRGYNPASNVNPGQNQRTANNVYNSGANASPGQNSHAANNGGNGGNGGNNNSGRNADNGRQNWQNR